MTPLGYRYSDGGRSIAGFRGAAGDCVPRAIAIAAGLPYRQVYDELAALNALRGEARSARNGTYREVYHAYLLRLGFDWTPTMEIGSGCRVHMRADELPSGALVARLSKHVCAVVDHVVFDASDPRRDGTRCVYGYYWTPTDPEVAG